MLGEPLSVKTKPHVNGILFLGALIILVLALSIDIFIFPNFLWQAGS